MAIENLSYLQRFRRVAQNHGIPLSDTTMSIVAEIEYLRNRLNAAVYLESPPWMLPSWVDLMIKGLDEQETLISELQNNSYRNWSVIGGVGSKKFGLTDSRGLVTALEGFGSIDVWVLDTDGIIFPALMGKDGPQLRLVSSEDQLYEWKTYVQSVEFTRLLYHIEKEEMEYLYNELIVRNISLEDAMITFYVAIRPMSVLGFEPIETLEFNAKTNQVFVNERPVLQVNTAPSAVYLVEANDVTIPEVIQTDKIRYDYKNSSKDGLGTAILRFNISLTPAGTKTIICVSPLSELEVSIEHRPDSDNRNISIGKWYEFTKNRLEAFFPDEKLDTVLSQAAASLAIQSHSVLFSDDSNPASFNWRDRMRVLYALVKSGGFDIARQMIRQLTQVTLDAALSGPLLWGFLKTQMYSPQKGSLQEIHKIIAYLTENLTTAITSDQSVVKKPAYLSEEFSNDESKDTPLEHYLVLNPAMLEELIESLWNFAALRESLNYLSQSEAILATKVREKVALAENRLKEQLHEIQNARWPRSNEPTIYDIDRAILEILSSIVQLRIDGIDRKYLRSLCKMITERRLVLGLWKTQEPKEFLSSHLALRIAQFHVWEKQRDAAEPILRRALEFLSEDFLLPEYVNPRTFGGSGGAGSSVMAATDIILLLSDMLAHEDNNSLVYLAGIPSEWYTAKKPLIINALHTRFGKTRIDIGQSANQHQIEFGTEILPDEVEVHVPESVPLRMVKVYGASILDRAAKSHSPHLRLIPLSNDFVLTYHR
ncbi:MAG: hypothetical protein ACFFCX_09920 [Candidatus Sifarchaeia archaeon]